MKFFKRNTPIYITGGALLILFIIIIGISQTREAPPPELSAVEGVDIIAGHTYIMGSPEAANELVMFTDYTSPEDTNYHEVLQRIYGDNSRQIKVALRHFPIKKEAFISSKAAQAAGEQGKFWEYSTALYSKTLEGADLMAWENQDYANLAKGLGIDTKAFSRDLEDESLESIINTDIEHGKALGVEKTPAFFFNEEMLFFTDPLSLEQKIQEEMDRIEEYGNKESETASSSENSDSRRKRPSVKQERELQRVRVISFLEEGWDPKRTSVVKGQRVQWINETEEEIILRPLDKHYKDLSEDIPIQPGESIEFKFTVPGTWRYREVISGAWGSIHTADYLDYVD